MFTNLASRKGVELATNPNCALTWYWPRIFRQVNVRGRIERAPDEVSDRLWAERGPIGQAASLVSQQGAPLDNLDVLRTRVSRFSTEPPPARPAQHCGIALIPTTIEFWLGRPDRLHERLHYRIEGNQWRHWALQP